jgi:hypothetical protein
MKADKFVLRIDLGNDACRTPGHVAALLREIAVDVSCVRPYELGEVRIRDINGNTVGAWSFEKED